VESAVQRTVGQLQTRLNWEVMGGRASVVKSWGGMVCRLAVIKPASCHTVRCKNTIPLRNQ